MESPIPDSACVDKTSLTQSSQWEIKGHHATFSTLVSCQEQREEQKMLHAALRSEETNKLDVII